MKKNIEQRGYRVTDIEDNAYETESKLKKAALIGLSALLIAMGTNYYMYNHATVETDGVEYYRYQTVAPIERTTYSLPSGGILTSRNGEPIGEIRINATVTQNEEGKTVYTLPAGYSLERKDGKVYGVRYVEPLETVTYEAPEGYVLVGDKCYKMVEQEVTNGKTK